MHALTLAYILENNARHRGDVEGFVFGERRVTHRDMLARARRLASAWYRRGLQPLDRVAILSYNCLEYCETYAAGEIARLITATVNFRLAPPEIAYIVNDAAPKVLVFEAAFTSAIEQIRASLSSVEHFVCIGDPPEWAEAWDAVVASGDPAHALPAPRPDDTAYIIYTSGTTGRPKGCMLSHAGCLRGAEMVNNQLHARPDDRMLLMMPLFHIGAKAIQHAQHWQGGTVHIHRGFEPEQILADIARHRITITHMAPVMIQALVEHPRIATYDLSSLRTLLYAAAPMPEPVLRAALACMGAIFIQMYGQTEGFGTVLDAAAHRLDGDVRSARRLTSVGIAFPGTQLRIVDDAGRDCGDGEPGEVLLRGPATMQGYWNNMPATLDAIRGEWLHTGDIGRQDADGFLYLVDRKKDVIISGGENIYSREVEEALDAHPAVAASAVIGVPDPKWGETVHALVHLRDGRSVDAEALIAHCRALIAPYKRPRYVTFVDDLPKLPSGKVDKKLLRRTYGA